MSRLISLTPTELRALLEKAREHDHRTYLLFLVTVLHGCRVSEVINLRVKDFSFDGNDWYLGIQRSMGGNRTCEKLLSSPDPLFDEARLMSDWLQGMKPPDFVFTNVQDEPLTRWGITYFVKKYSRWAGIPEHKRFPDVLKNTYGVLMRKRGANVEVLQKAFGRKHLNSTAARFSQVTQDEVDDARSKAFGKEEK